MKYLFQSCRPKSWTKNLLVFASPLFVFEFDKNIWIPSIFALISFCFSSSFIYILNDIFDIENDRKHPTKKFRPIPSGKVSIKKAIILAITILFLSLFIAFQINFELGIIIVLYLLIQISYCLALKKVPLIDIFCISTGFLLRSVAGGVSTNLSISPWFLLTVGLLALFLALEKRKAELRNSIEAGFITRKVLQRYSLPLLLRLESLVATSSFISYSLWASGPSLNGAKTSWMLLTVPFVLLGIFRYQFISDPEEFKRRKKINALRTSENPEEILIRDKGIKLIIFSWLLTTLSIGIIYGRS